MESKPVIAAPTAAPVPAPAEPDGLVLEVKETVAEEPARAASPVAATTPLDPKDAERLLARLPALAPEPAAQTTFAKRSTSLPAPKTGITEELPWPPKQTGEKPTTPAVKPGPLTVRRYGPTGDVPIATDVSVTFSQPMVAVGTVDQTKAQVPVKLTPEPAGEWRWLGTETVTFAPKVRMPMATKYSVEIPKETRSAIGGVLAARVGFTFATPPPTLQQSAPVDVDNAPLDPLIFLAFDQRVSGAELLPSIRVDAHGRVDIRLATADEIAADSATSELYKACEPERCVVIKTTAPLPKATKVKVTVKAGARSAEGPLKTTKDQSFGFSTYGPFRVSALSCWTNPCNPDSPVNVALTNVAEPSTYKDGMIRIDPPYKAQITVNGGYIQISGRKKSNTTYTFTIDGGMRDVFGQSLEAAKVSITTGPTTPQLYLAREGFATITPDNPRLDVMSAGQPTVHVKIYKVEPQHYGTYIEYQQHGSGAATTPPGTIVRDSDITVAGDPDDLVATAIDLTPALTKGSGNAIVVVSGLRRYRRDVSEAAVWIQVTPLGLDAFADYSDLTAWVTDLSTGAPVAGATVELLPTNQSGKTDSDGLAKLSLTPSSNATRVLIAHHGDDTVMLPPGSHYWDTSHWHPASPGTRTLLWMTDDRGMYKPGETAHFKGFARNLTGGKTGELQRFSADELTYEITDARGNSIGKGRTTVSQLGGFDFAATFADNVNLGDATVQLKSGDSYVGQHGFQIQEFRRPEFEVSASVNDGVHLIGEPQRATVKAAYYAGGALAGAPVRWRVTASNASFTPPGRDQFVFGIWEPWWRSHWGGSGNLVSTIVKGVTDAKGMHSIAIDPKSMKPHRATSIAAEASITDVNRQTWSAKATMLVHAADLYAGIKADRLFVEPGKTATFDFIAVDVDGKAVAGRDIRIGVKHQHTVVENGQSSSHEVEDATTSLISADAPVRWTFTPKEGGLHRVSADVSDDKGRSNHTEIMLWVPGEKRPEVEQVKHEELTLIPSAKEYKPGDVAEILVQAPFREGDGLVLVERSGLLSTTKLTVHDGSAVAKVTITEELAPNFTVAIEAVGAVPDAKTKKPRPAFASGHLDLSVSTAASALTVDVLPQSCGLSPGESTKVTVSVKDDKGKAVSHAEVALIVVDEAVLALSGFTLTDPLAVMQPRRSADVDAIYLRDSVLIARAEHDEDDKMLDAELERVGGGGAPGAPPMSLAAPAGEPVMRMRAHAKKEAATAQPETPIAMRTDFSALAAFIPKLVTDGAGKVTATVKLPDNLTRYRVMAVAAGSVRQFGKGESTITARLPLMVRPSPPRFLNFGDSFELPAVVHNQTEQAMDVDVVARAVNLEIATKGVRVHVGPGARVEVRFPAKTVSAGTAKFQIGVASGKAADAADQRLAVWTPATSEAFATYGVLDGNATIVQPIDAPADVFPEAGGLTMSTSSTALQSLTDAIVYLVRYPFECSEQLSSRILTIVAMKDVLAAFAAEGLPAPSELNETAQHDLTLLKTRQAENGGFGFWDRRYVSPYVSIHVLHALVRAKAAGYAVDAAMLERAMGYARNVETDMHDYPSEIRELIVAYALMVRARAGDVDLQRANAILTQGAKKLPVETLGFLLPVLHRGHEDKQVAAVTKELERRVTETAASAHFVTSYHDSAHLILASDHRADAIVLGALMEAQPQTDLIPKVVRGLLDGRRKGRWYTTQENVFVLLALGDYFQQFEKQTPEFVARLWLGDGYAGEAEFHGREITTRELVVPMKELVTSAKTLTVQKQGQGRMYYRIGLDYAPKSLELAARDNGFMVERTYEAVDDPKSVSKDAGGVWHVKAGAKVRVKLTMVAPAVRYHVALVDPLPAGFEALDSALKISESPDSESAAQDGNDDDGMRARSRGRAAHHWFWWRASWYEHENLRDERVEAFGTEVWAGVHDYTYVARATTPGSYVVPPTKAEEMYAPETFGRSASTRVIVE